jgi:hypothetical protein
MSKIAVLFFLVSFGAKAYVPTVESLFRHGGNPDVISNTVALTFKVGIQGEGVSDEKSGEFFKLFLSKNSPDSIKLTQVRYSNNSFSDGSFVDKVYYPSFNATTIKATTEQIERGLFFSWLKSITLNDGAHIINYLKSLNIPVKSNYELINQDKVELLSSYKRYLINSSKDRSLKDMNPLAPQDPAEKARVETLMDQPMYNNTQQVSFNRENGLMVWQVKEGAFEATFSFEKRHPLSLKYKTDSAEFSISCEGYWLANGTHYIPKKMLIHTFKGENYEVEIESLKHFSEREDDLVKRLQRWDQLQRAKSATPSRPEFLL